jgi:hypothetical protein
MKLPSAFLAALMLIGGIGFSNAAVVVRPGTEDLPGPTINWHSTVFDMIVDSKGDPLDELFTVELGLFAGDFEPLETNVDDWLANWVVFDQADFNPVLGYFTGVAKVLPDGTSDSAEMTSGATSFANEMAYIWIRKGDAAVAGSEWLLVNDPSWVFPAGTTDCCGNGVPFEWATSDLDSGDVPEFGRQGGVEGSGVFTSTGDYDLQTATFPVPEPSTMGLFVLAAFGLLRRRRG